MINTANLKLKEMFIFDNISGYAPIFDVYENKNVMASRYGELRSGTLAFIGTPDNRVIVDICFDELTDDLLYEAICFCCNQNENITIKFIENMNQGHILKHPNNKINFEVHKGVSIIDYEKIPENELIISNWSEFVNAFVMISYDKCGILIHNHEAIMRCVLDAKGGEG